MNIENMNKIVEIANNSAIAAIASQKDKGMDVSWTSNRSLAVIIASAVEAITKAEILPKTVEANGKTFQTSKLIGFVLTKAWLAEKNELGWLAQPSTQQKKAVAAKLYAAPEKKEKEATAAVVAKRIEDELAELE